MLEVSRWSPAEIVAEAVSADERLWVPTANPGVHVRPLLFDTVRGAWVNVPGSARPASSSGTPTRARCTPTCSRASGSTPSGSGPQRRPLRLRAAGRHPHHDGPRGRVADDVLDHRDVRELDEDGATTGYADVFTRIEQAERHFEAVGLGADHVRQYVR